MRVLDDPIVGRIAYVRFFWEREEALHLFGRDYLVRLRFRGDEESPIKEVQRRAYAGFDGRRHVLLAEAGVAAHRYYEQIAPEYREMLGDDAESRVPVMATVNDLAAIVTPTHLMFPRAVKDDERIVGLVCDCSWEPGLGLGIKFVNEVVAEVGTQDIVL